MKKELTSLVYEALTKLHYTGLKGEVKEVLTTLAEKASQNGLQPLPEEMPEWFITYFNNRGNDAAKRLCPAGHSVLGAVMH